jgi:hypothetical protein
MIQWPAACSVKVYPANIDPEKESSVKIFLHSGMPISPLSLFAIPANQTAGTQKAAGEDVPLSNIKHFLLLHKPQALLVALFTTVKMGFHRISKV